MRIGKTLATTAAVNMFDSVFDRSLGLMLIGTGVLLIWLGPNLSGWGAINATWCHAASGDFSAQFSSFIWHATQHCPYCYIGTALIALGSLTTDLSLFKRH
jgi:hypothetical protein